MLMRKKACVILITLFQNVVCLKLYVALTGLTLIT